MFDGELINKISELAENFRERPPKEKTILIVPGVVLSGVALKFTGSGGTAVFSAIAGWALGKKAVDGTVGIE